MSIMLSKECYINTNDNQWSSRLVYTRNEIHILSFELSYRHSEDFTLIPTTPMHGEIFPLAEKDWRERHQEENNIATLYSIIDKLELSRT